MIRASAALSSQQSVVAYLLGENRCKLKQVSLCWRAMVTWRAAAKEIFGASVGDTNEACFGEGKLEINRMIGSSCGCRKKGRSF